MAAKSLGDRAGEAEEVITELLGREVEVWFDGKANMLMLRPGDLEALIDKARST